MKTPWEIQRSLFCCTEGECHKCYYEKECEGRKMAETLLPDVLDFIVELKKERDAAVKCAQRFSYCNERKCRWCRFGFLDKDKEWDCAHPLKDAPCKGNPFAYPCRRFEYVYREGTEK